MQQGNSIQIFNQIHPEPFEMVSLLSIRALSEGINNIYSTDLPNSTKDSYVDQNYIELEHVVSKLSNSVGLRNSELSRFVRFLTYRGTVKDLIPDYDSFSDSQKGIVLSLIDCYVNQWEDSPESFLDMELEKNF